MVLIIWRQPFSIGLVGLDMETLLCSGIKACVTMPSGKGTLYQMLAAGVPGTNRDTELLQMNDIQDIFYPREV